MSTVLTIEALQSAATAVDGDGGLWLFGGEGYGTEEEYGYLNDLWLLQVIPPTFIVVLPPFRRLSLRSLAPAPRCARRFTLLTMNAAPTPTAQPNLGRTRSPVRQKK